ncbi:MAG: dihydroorotase [Candidatus Aminicenantes bacterium]|nr:dihydroorotase [Candidatus Aminicenantes bacterium]MDH5466041.1 dihydroorotase [Candidatus Aminicenantes bacterium]MDH5704984.1 dihydroorotase [Candidatus Aminicenantes bacterium]
MKLLIKNGRVVDPSSGLDKTIDVLIDKGKIAAIKPNIRASGAKIIDASRLVVAPGFIDMHVHLREPGQEEKETLSTGALAAARGGFTSIACMPNTEPVNDNRGVTEYILSEAKKNAVVNIFPVASITRRQLGEELTDMADLNDAGAVAFSDDGFPVQNAQVMRRALEYSKILSTIIIDHCEDKNLSAEGVMHEGYHSYLFGLKGIPSSSEEVMVSRDIILAQRADSPVHIAHLSTKGATELVRDAKRKKVKITAEVTPHHLFLTDSSLENYDTSYKVNPPLRSKEDAQALIRAVKDGIIDAIATDHAPHTVDDKSVEFDKAPFGINGLETAVSLCLDRLVNAKVISLHKFIKMISFNPALILGLENKGRIQVGADADLTLLNLRQEIVVDINTFKSKGRNNPFHGWKLKGAPQMTIVGGKVVYSSSPSRSSQ